jgi:hypothetical protein
MTDTVQDICRPRERSKHSHIIGGVIVGDQAPPATKVPAVEPTRRRRRPVPADFKVRLDAVTRNPGEDCARLKIRIDLDTLSGLIKLCQKQGHGMESLIRRCLKRELGYQAYLARKDAEAAANGAAE